MAAQGSIRSRATRAAVVALASAFAALSWPLVSCGPDAGAGANRGQKGGAMTTGPSTREAAAWQADPFAGTRAIEVRHAGQTYRVVEPDAVTAVLGELKVDAVWNDVGRASIPPAWVTFHKTDGTSVKAGLENDGVLSVGGGLVWPEGGLRFARALGRHVAGEGRPPVDLLEFRRDA